MTDRKKDHIELALKARLGIQDLDRRFFYEPLMGKHPAHELRSFEFLGKKLSAPLWVSSMTGGTELAGKINHNLARACHEFGLGMGLGSCRKLLYSDEFLPDFDLREMIGDDLPFYANLGIAQVEELVMTGDISPVKDMISRLRADGLIIHVNPLQEWLQPEGNRLTQAPVDTIRTFLEMSNTKVIVKEVGQGMGPESLTALFELPLEAIEFGAFGGTNFALLELMRSDEASREYYDPLSKIGHDAIEMTEMVNLIHKNNPGLKCRNLIISGGINNFLDGYYLINRSKIPAIYGQASAFLKFAGNSYEDLKKFIQYQLDGLRIAEAYLRLKD